MHVINNIIILLIKYCINLDKNYRLYNVVLRSCDVVLSTTGEIYLVKSFFYILLYKKKLKSEIIVELLFFQKQFRNPSLLFTIIRILQVQNMYSINTYCQIQAGQTPRFNDSLIFILF